jgi:prepilin-type N-terminal cleavage/methylation domain-containing protein
MAKIKPSRFSRNSRLRGFTLVECLVALAVLGVASLTMATIYSAVARMSRDNEFMNISLSEQMKYVEARTAGNTEAVAIEGTPVTDELTTHGVDTTNTYYVTVTGGPADSTGAIANSYTYEYGVNMYVLYSRDVKDNSSADSGYVYDNMYDESKGKLRYKYLLPRNPA